MRQWKKNIFVDQKRKERKKKTYEIIQNEITRTEKTNVKSFVGV